jgi:hypothetical protein
MAARNASGPPAGSLLVSGLAQDRQIAAASAGHGAGVPLRSNTATSSID